jgi:uncharacterized OB-fold protein
MSAERAPLTAPYVLEYTYRRSVGPVLSQFLGGLRDGKILGAKTAGGRVVVPPTEHDPDSGEAVGGDLVEVGQAGIVVTWAWVSAPSPNALLARPHALALVKLDGADTSMIHAVDAASPGAMRTGMRVRARWRSQRTGEISDIECFEPEKAP